MSEVWRDSFDFYTGATGRGYNAAFGGHSATQARTGEKGIFVTSSGTSAEIKRMNDATSLDHATFYQGIAIKRTDSNALGALVFCSDSMATVHVTVSVVIATGAIQVARGTHTGTVLATSAVDLIMPDSTWHYLEAMVLLGDAGVGQYRVMLDGVEIIPLTTGDTKNGGTKTVFDSHGLRGNATCYLDDYYVCNGAGSINNTFYGDTEILARFPTADGDLIQLTPSAGSNWSCVDDTGTATLSDYVTGQTDGNRDRYVMSDIPNAGTVHSVSTIIAAAKVGTDTKYVRDNLKSGSTVSEGSSNVLSTSLAYMRAQVRELNPDGNIAWTPTAVNAIQVGPVVKDS